MKDLPYTSPDADDAPWFDPIVPESKEFHGLLGLELTGLSKASGRREPVPLTTGGASLHPLRRAHREVQLRALAVAASDCGLSYGLSWLASVLRGGCATAACEGESLCFFTCCPPCAPFPDPPPDPPPPGQPIPPDPCDPFSDRYWREVLDVGLLQMEDPANVRHTAGRWWAEIVITLAAGNPFIYSAPTPVVGTTTRRVIRYDPNASVSCAESVDCLRDPRCPQPPVPLLPPPPVDICFPTGSFPAWQSITQMERDLAPAWAEKVPYIKINTAARKMERVTVRWYLNPRGLACADEGVLDPCNACAEINLPAIPAQSTLTIDGRSEIASIDCPGGPGLLTAEPQLYGPGGRPFVWPVFTCADAMCLEVIAQAGSVDPAASIEIFTVTREEAI